MGNACRIGTSHAIEVQYGSFYAEFSDEQNKANYTSLACLVQKLQHLLKIAISGRWRCLFPKSKIKLSVIWKMSNELETSVT